MKAVSKTEKNELNRIKLTAGISLTLSEKYRRSFSVES